jgi:hypothetical protein
MCGRVSSNSNDGKPLLESLSLFCHIHKRRPINSSFHSLHTLYCASLLTHSCYVILIRMYLISIKKMITSPIVADADMNVVGRQRAEAIAASVLNGSSPRTSPSSSTSSVVSSSSSLLSTPPATPPMTPSVLSRALADLKIQG